MKMDRLVWGLAVIYWKWQDFIKWLKRGAFYYDMKCYFAKRKTMGKWKDSDWKNGMNI